MNGPSLYDTRKMMYVSPNSILPNPDQPRRQFDPASLSELAESILRYGVLQPLTVRRLPQGGFELVSESYSGVLKVVFTTAELND